jgi:hypothetical protein
LPQIQIELENTIQKTHTGLQQLPKPPSSDPVGEVAGLLHLFIGELDKVLEGVPRADGLLQVIRPAQERFRREIRNTAPDFRPFEEPRGLENISNYEPFGEPAFLANEDGDEGPDDVDEEPYARNARPIFIDAVLERAHAYVAFTSLLLGN